MKQTMDKQEDRLLREALQRRADRVPALSDEFQEGVLERIRGRGGFPLTGEAQGQGDARLTSTTKGGEGLRHGGWRTWTWVASVAAMIVIGFFLFHGKAPSPNHHREEGVYATDVAVAAEAPEPQAEAPSPEAAKAPIALKGPNALTALKSPKVSKSPKECSKPEPREEQRSPAEVSGPVPTYADLQATLEQMEREALREANNMTMQALARVDAAQCPS